MIATIFPFLVFFYFLCLVLPLTAHAGVDVQHTSDNCGSDPLGIYEGHLIMKSLVTSRDVHSRVDKLGYLAILGGDSRFTSFSLDVGFNRGQTSTAWHAKQPNLYVIGIDANSHLVRQFENGPEFESIREHTMVLHAAASSRPGVMTFNPGFGWNNVSDTGSLFPFKDAKREAVRLKHLNSHIAVRSIRLDAILKYVPPPRAPVFLWDTLKLDVQGADVDALISSGDYVERFMCVVGEFETLHYATPEGISVDPAPFLKLHQFVCVYDVYPGNSIWLNKRHFAVYKENPMRFGCHSVYDSLADTQKLITVFEKGGLR